jgi:hypothetical protein
MPAGAASADPTLAEQIVALGLPTYEGKTTLASDAGRLEAAQLAVGALGVAGKQIAADNANDCTTGVPCILVGGADTTNFTEAAAISVQISGFESEFEMLGIRRGIEAASVLPGLIAGVGALAGMVRTDSTVTGVTLAELNDAMLVLAVAEGLKGKVVLPGALVGKTKLAESDLIKGLGRLIVLNRKAREERDRLQTEADAKPPGQKVRIAELSGVIKRFDDFFAKITTVSDSGSAPIARAVRVEAIFAEDRPILTVRVNLAAGSLTNSKNLGTFFGGDPIRISGGLIVSYLRTAPSTGGVSGAGLYNCRTVRTTLRRVQAGNYTVSTGAKGRTEIGDGNIARCSAVVGTPAALPKS